MTTVRIDERTSSDMCSGAFGMKASAGFSDSDVLCTAQAIGQQAAAMNTALVMGESNRMRPILTTLPARMHSQVTVSA